MYLIAGLGIPKDQYEAASVLIFVWQKLYKDSESREKMGTCSHFSEVRLVWEVHYYPLYTVPKHPL